MRPIVLLGIAAVMLVAGCGSSGPSSAQDVVQRFSDAGLSVPSPRDNSHNCDELQLGCIEFVTTESVTVMRFADETAAKEGASAYGKDTYQQGVYVLSFGAQRTPEDQRRRFTSELNRMVGE
ncbi:hypothetical protein [Microbispora sp. CA-102843]|uniref:hypothetical protein n=1 Tax=Microbispora sp. CA-102843 TaxID=3239952 RepID=UPI003D8A54B3